MKKYFSLIIVIFMLFSMNGCNENSNTAADNTMTNGTDIEIGKGLTNPGEYLADLCSNMKVGDIEISLPCSFEEMEELFNLMPTGDEKDTAIQYEKYKLFPYNLYSKDGRYFGYAYFAFYKNEHNKINSIATDSFKLFLVEEHNEVDRDYTTPLLEVNEIKLGKSTVDVVNQKIGKGFLLGEGFYHNKLNAEKSYLYSFEDGLLIIYFIDGVVSDMLIKFNPLII